ncbi:cargo protein (transmembrane protein tmp21 homologue), putative [Theileria annulata]|uniref:Cargo protein (Transmembrane protein tmp21 homologue), putative n=1 Tax=Theileria annulata TaxID=5874 RepID=Q4UE31_THEAN|nr:cargo protein (transmembrane protein tmp21 homologue), putative [Theileria annulata]CAI74658.1 cargo protein (transmembrane protein tmp21 homologue), putative [Theileria annulata]|eukprot:XP_952390.1 cargo protein (transmembrane protein tmp21 homologue), putative [Theileria annulata]
MVIPSFNFNLTTISILILFNFTIKSSCSYIDATTYLEPYQQFCLSEVVGKDMFVHLTFGILDLKPDQFYSAYVIEEGSDQYIFRESAIRNDVSLSFTSVEGPSITLCVNGPQSGTNFNFSLKFGADARDYSIIAKSSHLDPVDIRVQNVLDELSAFHKAQIIGASSIDRISEKAIKTYHLLARFAIANSVFVIFSTLCYIFYFRNFFKSKKLI